MGDRQWPDPRGWEALTQQEAETDVVRREMRDLAEQTIDATLPYEETWYTNAANVVDLLALLAVAERERDQAREALRRIVGWPVVHIIEARRIARDALDEEPQT